MKNSPVVAENPPEFKMKNSQGNITTSGFPFEDPVEDDAFGRDGFRTQLDSLAARHPQFAQQLRGAPWGGSWGRKRRGSGSLAETDTRDQQSGPSGEAQPPFQEEHSRGFPFDDFPSDFRQHIPAEFEFPREFQTYSTIPRKPRQREFNPRQEFATASAAAKAQAQPQAAGVPERKDFSTQTEPPQEERIQQPLQQAHTQTEPIEQPAEPLSQHGLRNTVDLGQKVSQLDDSIRNQRSMSAPPESRQRFVSRINIDPLQNQGMGQYSSANKTNQSPTMAAQQNTSQGADGPNVRHIPIFVEGRDDPIINKYIDTSAGASRQQVPESMAFGETLYAPQAPAPGSIYRAAQGFAPNTQKQAAPNQRQCPPKQQQPQQQQQQKQATPPPQPPPPVVNDPISKIQMIQKDVLDLMSQVEVFVGTRKDKQYVYLDEMLTRNLLKLDDVETEGKDNIRQARKEAIRCIQKCIAVLEAKADGLADQFKPMEDKPEAVEQSNNAPGDSSKMDVDQSPNEGTANVEKSPSQKMETENTKNEDGSISKTSSKSSVTNTATKSDSKSSIVNDVIPESNATAPGNQSAAGAETKPTEMEVETQAVAAEASH